MVASTAKRMATADSKRIQAAFDEVVRAFPFGGYMSGVGVDAYRTVADVVCRYLSAGDAILDFGAGPCDTAAFLQRLGYRCFACDDLSDDWHEIGENRQKILKFAAEQGVLFEHMKEPRLPDSYPAQFFDMAMLHAVIEHLHDSPRELLNDILQVVRSGGLKRMYILITRLFPGWKDSWLLVARKPANWTPRRSIPPQEWRKIRGKYTRYEF